MTELTQDLPLAQARSLMDSYAFDLGGDDVIELLDDWLNLYSPNWIRLATIEALYQGRYKAISIEQILKVWLRLGTPNPHFTYEFERLICRKLPNHLSDFSSFNSSTFEPDNHDGDWQPADLSTETVKQTATASIGNGNADKIYPQITNSEPSTALMSSWGLSYSPIWSDFTEGSRMIHQFIPLPDVSSFFARLKTFGEEKLENSN
ncbi:MAG: hypothetical protein AAFQ41_00045 [Cyanobacteria bacterium J06623_7]